MELHRPAFLKVFGRFAAKFCEKCRLREWPVTDSEFDFTNFSGRHSDNRIEKRVWIKASAEIVYRALTNSKDLSKWFCDRADCTPTEGGKFLAFWKAGKSGQNGRAIFTRVIPNSTLELLWIEEGRDTLPGSPKHTLSYKIKSKSGMTEVVMVDNDEAAADDETYAFIDSGWNSVLLELKDFCERRERSLKLHLESKAGSDKTSPE